MNRQAQHGLGRRGISPYLSTLILVGIVVAATSLFVLWGKGYTEEIQEKQGLKGEKSFSCGNEVHIEAKSVDASKKTILVENKGVKVDAFTLRIFGDDSEGVKELYTSIGSGGARELPFSTPDVASAVRVEIIPRLKLAKGVYQPCSEKLINVRI